MVAIVLEPAPGDPGELLAPGAFGASPPVVHRASGGGGGDRWCPRATPADPGDAALPLWWDADRRLDPVVPEGWDRACRRAFEPPKSPEVAEVPWDLESLDFLVACRTLALPHLGSVRWLGKLLVRRGIARRVTELGRVDGALVEIRSQPSPGGSPG